MTLVVVFQVAVVAAVVAISSSVVVAVDVVAWPSRCHRRLSLACALLVLKFPQSRAFKVPAVIIRHRAGLQFSTDLS